MNSSAVFDSPQPRRFDVFDVLQLATDSFLDGIMGADFVEIGPNLSSRPHRHNHSDNLIYVMSGHAILSLNDVAHPISQGVRVFVPRGMWHAFKTAEENLRFISIQVPPILDPKRNLFDLEVRDEPSTPSA